MKKYLSFRFDVDSHKCLEQGVPNLIQLGDELGVRFTFFVSMGRATSRLHSFKKLFERKHKNQILGSVKLSSFSKLGPWDFFRTVALNPRVGSNHVPLLLALEKSGHEVGLHGGLNHGAWHHGAMSWSRERLQKEVETAFGLMIEVGIKPIGFSSPGWQSPPELFSILNDLNFRYVADSYGCSGKEFLSKESGLFQVPVNVRNNFQGVGYLESGRAQGKTSSEILDEFVESLSGVTLAAVYDHPYYAGVKEISLLRDMIKAARAEGFDVVPLSTILP